MATVKEVWVIEKEPGSGNYWCVGDGLLAFEEREDAEKKAKEVEGHATSILLDVEELH